MKPEICNLWEAALSHYRSIDGLLKDKKFEEAEKVAGQAWASGCLAIFKLSEELKIPELSEIARNAFSEWYERFLNGYEKKGFPEKHYTLKEKIEWYCRTLKRLSELCPPDTFPPLS